MESEQERVQRYACCPSCGVTGPVRGIAGDLAADGSVVPPYDLICWSCGGSWQLPSRAGLLALDATVRCPTCRHDVPCPATADRVHCVLVDGARLRGCGQLLAGPVPLARWAEARAARGEGVDELAATPAAPAAPAPAVEPAPDPGPRWSSVPPWERGNRVQE